MKVFKNNQLKLNNSVVSIGAFDGIHLGHQALIRKAKMRADDHGVPLVVYTFDPPPKAFFQHQMVLTPISEKIQYLQELGCSYTVIASFDQEYASRSVTDFVEELALLHPLEIWVGPDFHFGKGKSGSITNLEKAFTAFQHPVVTCEEGNVISSTRIRNLLLQNKLDKAQSLLGRASSS
ncbi:FAD synthetase [Fredinandcohnia humi]